MTVTIHPSAVIHDGATLGDGVEIGPFCEVGGNVTLGERVKLHGRASVLGNTQLGADCEVFPGAVLGTRAQVQGVKEMGDTGLVVGARCVFREFTNMQAGSPNHNKITRIGSDCYFMAYSHVGHDGIIGDKCVFSNAVEVGGHVTVGDNVWMGGVVAVHQFTHIGDHAFISGGAIVVGDVIPFAVAVGNRAHLSGLNVNGLKRRGFTRQDMRDMRAAYQAIFEGDEPFAARVDAASVAMAHSPYAMQMIDFIRADRPRALCLPEPK